MVDLFIHILIVVLVCGFIFWAWRLLSPHLPIAGPFKSVADVLIYIIIAAIILFYVIIPLLSALPRAIPRF